MADGESGEEGVAHGVEDGVVCDLEGRGEGKVGWVEEGVTIGVDVDACRLVGSTCRNQNVQRRRCVVIDVDGEIERVGDATLLWHFNALSHGLGWEKTHLGAEEEDECGGVEGDSTGCGRGT